MKSAFIYANWLFLYRVGQEASIPGVDESLFSEALLCNNSVLYKIKNRIRHLNKKVNKVGTNYWNYIFSEGKNISPA